MFERLFYDPQAREDARSGLRDMGRGIVTLVKWSAIVGLALVAAGLVVGAALLFGDQLKAHENSLRWIMAGGTAGYCIALLLQIRAQLSKLLPIVEAIQARL